MTETDDLARALDVATRRWPELSRPQLLVRPALEGAQAEQRVQELRREQRLAAVRRHSGSLTGSYEAGYLGNLRDDWPS